VGVEVVAMIFRSTNSAARLVGNAALVGVRKHVRLVVIPVLSLPCRPIPG
jgi:hypothetical protein